MKMKLTSKQIAASLLVIYCAGNSHADSNMIREITSADLGELAQQNSREIKQTMVIYYKDDCMWCDRLKTSQAVIASNGFRIYKTNTSTGFDITCPNGEYLSDHEFMAIKGIGQLPAAIITDNKGNVIHVENGLSNAKQLAALITQHRKRILADQQSIESD